MTILHRLARSVIVLRSHRLTCVRRIFAPLFFLEDSLSSRFLGIVCRRCIWRLDRSSADRDLLLQLELQWLYDPCVADRARCKQVTLAARSSSSFPPIFSWYQSLVQAKGWAISKRSQGGGTTTRVHHLFPLCLRHYTRVGALREALANNIGSRSCLRHYTCVGALWEALANNIRSRSCLCHYTRVRALREALANNIGLRSCLRQDEAISQGTIARGHHREAVFEPLFWVSRRLCAIRTRCQMASIKLLVRSLTRTTSMLGSSGWPISLWEKDFGTMWKVRMKTLQSCPRKMPLQ